MQSNSKIHLDIWHKTFGAAGNSQHSNFSALPTLNAKITTGLANIFIKSIPTIVMVISHQSNLRAIGLLNDSEVTNGLNTF